MTIDATRLLGLLEEVGRHRPLLDDETDIVEEIVLQDTQAFRWNPRLDQGLQQASACSGGIARFARRHGITPGMAYIRLHRIRKRKGCKAVPRRRQG